jgi:hypothetical protein
MSVLTVAIAFIIVVVGVSTQSLLVAADGVHVAGLARDVIVERLAVESHFGLASFLTFLGGDFRDLFLVAAQVGPRVHLRPFALIREVICNAQ